MASGNWPGAQPEIPSRRMIALRLFPLLPLVAGVAVAGSVAEFGARTTQPDPVLAKQFNLPEDSGHVITSVKPETPAAKLGLAKDDLVLSIDGKPASNIITLSELIAATRAPGQEVEVAWSHAGQTTTGKIKLGDGIERRDFRTLYQRPERVEKAVDLKGATTRTYSIDLSAGGSGVATTKVDNGEFKGTSTPGEGDKKKIEVIRKSDNAVAFKGEISAKELDKVPAECREFAADLVKSGGVNGAVHLMPSNGASSTKEQIDKPEHDVSELLNKLKAADDKAGK